MEVETLYSIALKILVFSIVVGFVGIISGGGIFSSIVSPIESDLGNTSQAAEDLENSTEGSFFLNNQGTIISVDRDVFLVQYDSEIGKVNSTVHGLTLVSEQNRERFNASGECYRQANSEFREYISNNVSDKEVILIIMNDTSGNNSKLYSSNMYLVDSEMFVGNELIKRGFAKISDDVEPNSEILELQEQAKQNDVGVWGC